MTRFLFTEACGCDYAKRISRNRKIAGPQCVKNCTRQIIIIIRLIAYNLCKIRVILQSKNLEDWLLIYEESKNRKEHNVFERECRKFIIGRASKWTILNAMLFYAWLILFYYYITAWLIYFYLFHFLLCLSYIIYMIYNFIKIFVNS